jgi:16S rRNA processing protein RimM
MGRIVAPYGVRGWVKIQPATEEVDGLLQYANWWLGKPGEWQSRNWVEGRAHGSTLVARLEGCEDRDQAFALRGLEIAVPRSALPAPEAGEFYWCDLIGLSVENQAGEALGQVEDVFATGANDVLVVRGERERLIPFIEPVVIEVDFAAAKIRVDWGVDY